MTLGYEQVRSQCADNITRFAWRAGHCHSFSTERTLAVGLILMLGILVGGCSNPDSLQSKAERFFELREEGKTTAARAMIAHDARIWFESRDGEGRAWNLDGPWTTWDSVFNSTHDFSDWTATDSSVSVVSLENNDFYRMVERDPRQVKLTMFFDEAGLIKGYLVQPVAKGPPDDKLDEFVAWASENYPRELNYVMPEGRLDPGADRPMRMKRLLFEWRNATGRSPVE